MSIINIVPTLDLARFEAPEFAVELHRALSDVGFVLLKNHGVAFEAAYAAASAFFDKGVDEKMAYHKGKDQRGQRGYTSFGTEHARDNAEPDLKEFFQVGKGDNVDVHGFDLTGVYASLEKCAEKILHALSRPCGKDFVEMTRGGDTVIRCINYPALESTRNGAGQQRSSQHEDVNLITLLLPSTSSGLEILDRSMRWVPVDAGADEMVVNVGDMMQALTHGRLRSTTHRVVNSSARRLSMPFFVHPRGDVVVIEDDGTTAAEFLARRLAEIGF